MRGSIWSMVLAIGAMSAGCSESTAAGSGAAGSGVGAAGGVGGVGGDPSGAGGAGGDGASGGGAQTGASVAINELDVGDDWVELFNGGPEDFDLSGLVLADDDAGVPKLDEAIEFPEGTTLGAGERLFVLAKQDDVVMPGLQEEQTECDPGTSPCFYAPFGLSSDGDAAYLLDGDDIIASAVVPAMVTGDGESYCRIPEGTGDLGVCTPTPGEANEE